MYRLVCTSSHVQICMYRLLCTDSPVHICRYILVRVYRLIGTGLYVQTRVYSPRSAQERAGAPRSLHHIRALSVAIPVNN